MDDVRSAPAVHGRWKRVIYVALVVAAIIVVMTVWFRTPEVQVESESADGGYRTVRCANGGPSRWDPPTVIRGQEVKIDPSPVMVPYNQQILEFNIESLRASVVCGQARDAHTNTLIVTTFAAGTILFFGYHALWTRRAN